MKIYLFGSNGMLGRYIYLVLKDKYHIIQINRTEFNIETDIRNKLYQYFENCTQDDIIINCIGAIPQKVNYDNIRKYILVNTLLPNYLDQISLQKNCKFIHITTDCVFDGETGNYTNNDIHTANDIYGVSKSLGENLCNACIIRTSIIGEERYHKKSLLEWVLSKKNDKINGFSNHTWNGITCLEFAKLLNNIIDKKEYWIGKKNVISPDIVSKYQLCCYINEIYQCNIQVHSYMSDKFKYMTLKGDIIVEKYIYQQIKELSEFDIYI